MAQQFIVQLRNEPGALATLAEALRRFVTWTCGPSGAVGSAAQGT